MKIKINRNTIWCDIFVQRLNELGVSNVCISPGSRSTPLTLAFSSNKNFSVFPIVDERSSAFFALGLAKKLMRPVAVVTTSGTAVAELYPAIIEAFYQRVPLIICTADRPKDLRNKGANQTINQKNIFNNHIRLFKEADLPSLKKLSDIKMIAEEAINYSCFKDQGPVHINFPFEKPFEPGSPTDSINIKKIENVFSQSSFTIVPKDYEKLNYNSIIKKLKTNERGLIIVGGGDYDDYFSNDLNRLSSNLGYPVFVDGTSSLRFNPKLKHNIIENFSSICKSSNLLKYFDPDLIIQFGKAPTSISTLEFFKSSKAEKFLVNLFGDVHDPSNTFSKILKVNPSNFCQDLLLSISEPIVRSSGWLHNFLDMNRVAEESKKQIVFTANFTNESRVVFEAISNLPNNCNLMISNSLPIRDIDLLVGKSKRKINTYCNRGASGIDGIISTALGIAKASTKPTYLITGDLAFFYDLTSLYNSQKFQIPLTIILINNNGGGIFESLPISKHKEGFRENFITPLDLEFNNLVTAFGGVYKLLKDFKQLKKELLSPNKSRKLTILEIKTDARKSKLIRQRFLHSVAQKIDLYIDEINSKRN